MSKIWVVTRAINDYRQDGDYFVGIVEEDPFDEEVPHSYDLARLLPLWNSDRIAQLIDTGGGRQGTENEWYYLNEIESGQEYQPYDE